MKTLPLSARALQTVALARELLTAHGLTGWSFRLNRSKVNLGLCRYGQRTIELSAFFVEENSDEAIRDTLLHEIAHALAGRAAGHGPLWRAMCLRVGAKPERLSFEAEMPAGRWQAVCGNCGTTSTAARSTWSAGGAAAAGRSAAGSPGSWPTAPSANSPGSSESPGGTITSPG